MLINEIITEGATPADIKTEIVRHIHRDGDIKGPRRHGFEGVNVDRAVHIAVNLQSRNAEGYGDAEASTLAIRAVDLEVAERKASPKKKDKKQDQPKDKTSEPAKDTEKDDRRLFKPTSYGGVPDWMPSSVDRGVKIANNAMDFKYKGNSIQTK